MRHETASIPLGTLPGQGYAVARIEARREIIDTIERLHAGGCPRVALVVIHLYYKPARALFPVEEPAHQSSMHLCQSLRRLVRRTDCALLYDHTCSIILGQADLQGAQIVEDRLWEALLWRVHNLNECEFLRPTQLAIGHGAWPEPHASPDALVRAAGESRKCFDGHADHISLHRAVTEPTRPTSQEELPKLARKLGIPYLALLPRRLPRRLMHVVTARLARELRCYPLGRDRNILTVAMLDPQDHQALERLRQETGLHIFPVLTHPEALEMALNQFS